MPGTLRRPVNPRNKTTNDTNIVEFSNAPSVEEADEILARFGYSEVSAELLVA